MRFTLILLLSIIFAVNAFGQEAERIQKGGYGNVIAVFGSQDSTDQNVLQKGAKNMFFIYSRPDSSAGNIEVKQLGYSNRILSVFTDGKSSVIQRFDQEGERNSIDVLQMSSSDSTGSNTNEIDVKQKGSGNTVTIIQQ